MQSIKSSDLRRNARFRASMTGDPVATALEREQSEVLSHMPIVLRARLDRERSQNARVTAALARRVFAVGWQSIPPVGVKELRKLVSTRD
jgi:hypothetical protein